MKKYPFCVAAAILLLILAGEVYAITRTPTYDAELAFAKAQYESALRENSFLNHSVNQLKGGIK